MKRYRTKQLSWEIKVRNMKRAEAAARIKALRDGRKAIIPASPDRDQPRHPGEEVRQGEPPTQNALLREDHWLPVEVRARLISNEVRDYAIRCDEDTDETHRARAEWVVGTLGHIVFPS
jgi:hypothetical protein